MPWPGYSIAVAINIPNVGGLVGNLLLRKRIKNIYENLDKPRWCPKSLVSDVTWTAVFSGTIYAYYLVSEDGGGLEGVAKIPLLAYHSTLALSQWVPIFLAYRNLKAAFATTIIHDAVVLTTAYLFYKINKTAGCLFIPFLVWSGFDTTLGYVIMRRNLKIKCNFEEKNK